jgi:TPP-dependent pyruvate/acetoin dehydrogenase alpha subunit
MLHAKIISSEEIEQIRNEALAKVSDKIRALNKKALDPKNSARTVQSGINQNIALCQQKIYELTMAENVNLTEVVNFLRGFY